MTDLVDERLAAAARRWQVEQPPPPGVPLDRLDERPPRRPWRRAALAAAAAVVVVGGGAAAVAGLGSDGASPAGPSGPPPVTVTVHGRAFGAVPWRDLEAGHPHVRHHEHGHVVTPYDHVSATGRIVGRVRPGDVLVFTAVLESATTLRLDPCPDYDVGFGPDAFYQWRLNCAQVPFRDAQGHPVLPAGRPVRFEMRIRVPDAHGRQKVLWTLDGPWSMPGFYGMVHVR